MKRCVCYDSHDYREKRILVKAHSYFAQGKVWSNVYCIRCGNQTYMDDTALCIDIEELNVPLDAIMEEFKKIGFEYISLDLEGYRQGSQNLKIKGNFTP